MCICRQKGNSDDELFLDLGRDVATQTPKKNSWLTDKWTQTPQNIVLDTGTQTDFKKKQPRRKDLLQEKHNNKKEQEIAGGLEKSVFETDHAKVHTLSIKGKTYYDLHTLSNACKWCTESCQEDLQKKQQRCRDLQERNSTLQNENESLKRELLLQEKHNNNNNNNNKKEQEIAGAATEPVFETDHAEVNNGSPELVDKFRNKLRYIRMLRGSEEGDAREKGQEDVFGQLQRVCRSKIDCEDMPTVPDDFDCDLFFRDKAKPILCMTLDHTSDDGDSGRKSDDDSACENSDDVKMSMFPVGRTLDNKTVYGFCPLGMHPVGRTLDNKTVYGYINTSLARSLANLAYCANAKLEDKDAKAMPKLEDKDAKRALTILNPTTGRSSSSLPTTAPRSTSTSSTTHESNDVDVYTGFWETQAKDIFGFAYDTRCLLHALNNFMGDRVLTDDDMNRASKITNKLQASLMENHDVPERDTNTNWSYQVLCQVGKDNLGVQFESLQALQAMGVSEDSLDRFIVQRSAHWVAVVTYGGYFWDLDSLAPKPIRIGKSVGEVKDYFYNEKSPAYIYAAIEY